MFSVVTFYEWFILWEMCVSRLFLKKKYVFILLLLSLIFDCKAVFCTSIHSHSSYTYVLRERIKVAINTLS